MSAAEVSNVFQHLATSKDGYEAFREDIDRFIDQDLQPRMGTPNGDVVDLELDLEDDLIASIQRSAARVGMEPEEWARLALLTYLGLPLTVAEMRALSVLPGAGPESTPPL